MRFYATLRDRRDFLGMYLPQVYKFLVIKFSGNVGGKGAFKKQTNKQNPRD